MRIILLAMHGSGSIATSHLRKGGHRVSQASNLQQVKERSKSAAVVVLSLPATDLSEWACRLNEIVKLPLFWWCSESDAWRLPEAETDGETEPKAGPHEIIIDGLLAPAMTEQQIHWALYWGAKRFSQRRVWTVERQQLLARIEGRQWIDAAKRMISEWKHISEDEAYKLLRKQAMDERRRIVDVAASIVKVYEWLQNPHSEGTNQS